MSELKEVTLPQGTVRYRDTGSGEPIVFVHGLLVNGLLWRKVTPLLDKDFRCIVPDWPLGAHQPPMSPDADLTPPGIAKLIDDFMAALDLEDVTLVGNDTGGAFCQVVATRHPERLGRLVLTTCDAYEDFLPAMFRPLQYLARVPGLLRGPQQLMRIERVRHLPAGFGWLVKRVPGPEITDQWVRPGLESAGVRRDAQKVLRGISNRYTIEAAARLRDFPGQVLLVWTPDDKVFKMSLAERLQADAPGARLETIEDSYSFIPEDQPERLAELIAGFVREPRPQAARAG